VAGRSFILVPRADRYGHPEEAAVARKLWADSPETEVAGVRCDRYGHPGLEGCKKQSAPEGRLGIFSGKK
jgi:hypothetical protein